MGKVINDCFVVKLVLAGIDINTDEFVFGESVDADMAFRNDHKAGQAAWVLIIVGADADHVRGSNGVHV